LGDGEIKPHYLKKTCPLKTGNKISVLPFKNSKMVTLVPKTK
jgi:hypothetical protein